ncbi:hypothetical protein GY45DRAFT_1321749 [Cubamyces sp. BRFM 1775]|nr:hypothetical protein GY45DRAFT_1321749 [Cubamyces sp. BRFM 1775]
MEEISAKGKGKATDDAFFLERLEMLYEQNLADMRAFADREGKPFDEVRRHVAELHSKALFDRSSSATVASSRKELIRQLLVDVSQRLESLETLAGLQSFFLAVDVGDPDDGGFLGGTLLGREFWRGHRGCGLSGAKAFKARCKPTSAWHAPAATPSITTISPAFRPAPPPAPQASGAKCTARELKATLYSAMRDALRAASGVRKAEMKWTNHSTLEKYGVRIVGWPESVPLQNPSMLSAAQNQLLLEMLGTGRIRFVRLDGTQVATNTYHPGSNNPHHDEDAMFEDAIDYSWACDISGEDGDHPPQTTVADNSMATFGGSASLGGTSSRSSRTHSPIPATDEPRSMTPKKRRVEEI